MHAPNRRSLPATCVQTLLTVTFKWGLLSSQKCSSPDAFCHKTSPLRLSAPYFVTRSTAFALGLMLVPVGRFQDMAYACKNYSVVTSRKKRICGCYFQMCDSCHVATLAVATAIMVLPGHHAKNSSSCLTTLRPMSGCPKLPQSHKTQVFESLFLLPYPPRSQSTDLFIFMKAKGKDNTHDHQRNLVMSTVAAFAPRKVPLGRQGPRSSR